MRTDEFDFELPAELIAQDAAPRGESRLLALDRRTGSRSHGAVRDLPSFLSPDDLLVINDTRVFPARLLGRRVPSGGVVECLLLHPIPAREPGAGASELWSALMHPGQKLKPGARVEFEGLAATLHAEVVERHFFGRRTIRLTAERGSVADAVDAIGHIPLPPYIHRADTAADRERYQTVFAQHRGSIAAPTAGLHFDDALLAALDRKGIERVSVTLHVGYGTFKPVHADLVEDHIVDPERYEVSDRTAAAVNAALECGRRIVAVGTTTTRALEDAARRAGGRVVPGAAQAEIFIYPGHTFRVIGGLLTNFHLPRSSLLMLVSALAGRDHLLAAYREAVAKRYRFYSYGDAMLIL